MAVAFAIAVTATLATTGLSLMPWQDWTLPLDDRVADLVGRLSTAELINQTWSVAPAIPRFNISAYNVCSCCRGGHLHRSAIHILSETQ